MSWEIKSKNNEVKFEVGKVEYNDEWMQERYVTVTIESPAPINFQIGDYLIYRGERFEINYDPGKIKIADAYLTGDAFRYENVKFNSLADELTRCDFLDVVLNDNQLHFTGLPKFSFYGGVKQLADRIQANLDKTYGKGVWNVVLAPEFSDTTELNVSIDTQKVSGVLADVLVNQFKTYYTIKGRTLTIGAAGVPADHLFQWGPGKGLYEIEENAEADQQIVTRLRAYGSTRNLPYRWYHSLTGADGKAFIPDDLAVHNLMLPGFPETNRDPYIDSKNIDALGVREGTIFFDGSGELEEIYPSIEGMTAEQLKAAGVPCNAEGALDVLVSAEQMTDNGVGKIEGDPLEGDVTTTAEQPAFKVVIKDIGFDINDHIIEGNSDSPTLSFKSGMLGGRDFEIVGCIPIKDAAEKVTGYELELNRIYDEDIKLWFPYRDYNAEAGNRFVLLHIAMPEVYIKAASQRLWDAAKDWLSKNDYSRSIYTPKIDENFMARQHDAAMASGGTIKSLHDTLTAGMQLLFEDEDLGIDAAIFIDRLTIIEGEGQIPTYEVVLKEEKTVGRLDKMQNQIDSLAAGQGQGGYTASQIRSLVTAYGGQVFLSKLKDDRSKGKITSDKGFDVGDFLAGVAGARFAKDTETGQTFLEVDRIYARVKAYFESLTIIEANTLAGKQYITPGGSIKCAFVAEKGLVEVTKERPKFDEEGNVVLDSEGNPVMEEYTELVDNGVPEDVYRCYFLSEQDGEKTETKMIVGDQAISEMFNAKTGTSNKVSNHRYWRLVTAVEQDAYTDDNGNHYGYIDLSKTDCEANSDIPREGDVIDQLGNRDDATRQAAMVFSTVDADAPSIKLFKGINSYSLSDKDIISYGYDTVKGNAYFKCFGDIYLGARDGSTLVRYDEQEKNFELLNVTQKVTSIIDGIHTTLSGTNGIYNPILGGKTIGTWWGGDMVDRFYDKDGNLRDNPLDFGFATSLVRLDGSAYFGGGMHAFNEDGTGWLGNYKNGITFDSLGRITVGSGVTININDEDKGLKETIESILNFQLGFENLLTPCDASGNEISWAEATLSDGNGGIKAKSLKSKVGLWSESFVSARGKNPWQNQGVIGASALADLSDVTLSDLAAGQSLVYNGTKWVNQTIQSGVSGLDESQLADYLTNNNYAKKSDIPSLTGYAKEQWVEGKGYITSSALAPYLKADDAANTYLTQTAFNTFESGYNTWKADVDAFISEFDSMFDKEADSSLPKGFRIKALFGLYTDEFLSARGLNPFQNQGVIGASALSDLTDVTLGTLASGQALVYNGTKWVNQTIKSGGLTQTELADYLTANRYVTESSLSTAVETALSDLFVKESDGNGGWRIKAKYGLYTDQFLSARGLNPDVSQVTPGLNWSEIEQKLIQNNYAKKSDIPSLSGYATQTWVNTQLGSYLPKNTYDAFKATFDTWKGQIDTFKATFEAMFVKDSTGADWNIKALRGVWTETFLSARGKNADGGSGSNFNLMRTWPTTAPSGNTTDALGANLGWELKTRIDNLPTTSVNPYALTIQKNGVTIDTYNGAAAKTVNISDVASASALSSHIGNGTIHITAAERTLWNQTATNLSSILGADSDAVINKWEEVVAFLDTYTEADTLAKLLGNKADKTQLGSYYTKTEADGRYVTALGTNGKFLTWTKNGSVSNITVPYATWAAFLAKNATLDYSNIGLQWFDDWLTAGCAANVNDAPTTNWWHILRFNHSNSNGYYTDLAIPFSENGIYYKRICATDLKTDHWVKILDDLNYSSILDTAYVKKSGDTMTGLLSISYTGETGLALYRKEGGGGAFIRFYNSNQTTNYFRVGMYGDNHFGISYNSGSDFIHVLTNNNVGIGTTNPAYKLDVNGTVRASGEIISTVPNAFRAVYGNYGFFIQNDGTRTFFLLTEQNDPYGTWNSLRPFIINNASGFVKMLNGVEVNSLKIGDVTITYDSANKGLKISGGGLYSESYISARGLNSAGSGGVSMNRLDNWADYTTAKDGYALSAKLGYDLYSSKADKSWVEAKGYLTSSALSNYVTLNTAQTITGAKTFASSITLKGSDIKLGTPETSSDDSGDLIWYYGNGNEKMRIWTDQTYTTSQGPYFRIYKKDGTSLYSGTLVTTGQLSSSLGNYLPLTGGTMTGGLNFVNANAGIYSTGNNLILKGGDGVGKLVIEANQVRRSANTDSVNLGTADIRWATVYANALNVTSTNVVSNLNADLLDGVHNGSVTAKLVNYNNDAGVTGLVQFMQQSSGWKTWEAPSQTWHSVIKLNHGNGDTYYSRVLAFDFSNNRIYTHCKHNGTDDGWSTLAFLSDNVASANKLSDNASYKAWGQEFFVNGKPKAVSGDMTGVGSITMTGAIINEAYVIAMNLNNTWSDGTNTHPWYGLDHTHHNTGIYSTVLSDYFGLSLKTSTGLLCMTAGGNVGIGTASPAYKLDVNGSAHVNGNLSGCTRIYNASTANLYLGNSDNSGWVYTQDICSHNGSGNSYWSILASGTAYFKKVKANTETDSYALNAASFICDSWVRTKGATGWYNETYAGGWYMSDTSWIRSYNGKSLHMGDGSVCTDYLYDRQSYWGAGWGNGYGAYNTAISDNGNQTPLMVAYRSGQSASATGANRLFSLELLNSGTNLWFLFGGSSRFKMVSDGTFYALNGIWSDGYVSARGQNTSSDARLKRNLNAFEIALHQIANAPSVGFEWLDGSKDVGSIAQYWQDVNPLLTPKGPDGYLTLQYGKTALLASITIAKKVMSHEERIAELERENKELKRKIEILERR